jgi:hypothetical protein
MALRDGEEPPLSSEAVRNHLASCLSSRTEAADEDALQARLAGMTLPQLPRADLWSSVIGRLAPRTRAVVGGVAAAAVLVRAACLVAAPETSRLGSIAVVGAIALGFAVLRENPFRVAS